jgi:AraC family transcriptional regulator
MRRQELLSVVHQLVSRPGNLNGLAARAGWSVFHLHRALRVLLGETPKRYALRLRLEHAAYELLASRRRVRSVAADAGFRSHEVFTRAFRRQFGTTPRDYRARALAGARRGVWSRHAAIVSGASPCIRLFHVPLITRPRPTAMPLTITRKDCPEQPILFIRRRIARSELSSMLAECFGKLFGHGHRNGLPIAGWPLARYVVMGPGLWTVEAAMPLASPSPASGDMQAGILPAGPTAFAVHVGAYERLPETHAAVERWIEAQGYQVGGAPWESYVTDPAQHPDTADWRTEVYWPLAPTPSR